MKYLQIWHGAPLPSEHLRCIESVLEKLDLSDEYIFIGDSRYVEKSLITIDYNDYLESEVFSNEEMKNIWVQYDLEVKKNPSIKQIYYDFLRMHFASKNEDTLYLDVDVILKKKLTFKEKKKPYFGVVPGRGADIFLFYTSYNIDFFKKILKKSIEFPKRPETFYSILNGYFKDDFSLISQENYSHLSNNVFTAEALFNLHGLKLKA